MKKICLLFFPAFLFLFFSCKKSNDTVTPSALVLRSATLNDSVAYNNTFANATRRPVLKITFSAALQAATLPGITITEHATGNTVNTGITTADNDSTVIIQPNQDLTYLAVYDIKIPNTLEGTLGERFPNDIKYQLVTAPDTSVNHFPQITDDVLLTLVQQQSFRYFWDFGHPVSGMARERNTSSDVVTTGGTGFGIMAIITGIERGFITRAEGCDRIDTIVSFLTNKALRYHGAFAHWINGATGATIPFSASDNGADLVETSYLMEGLLCARQYFDQSSAAETGLRNSINNLWQGVEWNWFRRNNEQVLYWHWSPDKDWAMNVQIRGWNECMVTYILAACAPVDSIPASVYRQGWAGNGSIANGHSYFGITLPLGSAYGGPLFFAHYSFMGIDPNGLVDAYANYGTQNTAHSQIDQAYCIANPKRFNGYNASCWGLTASDEAGGYSAHAPDNDNGTISPTAAVSSLPYTPAASMNAIRFFYYKLGDKLWGTYGFKDAFNLTRVWFADSYLAIDQGPQIVMIENYRTKLLWNLFMSCPEIKNGMQRLGFSSPHF